MTLGQRIDERRKWLGISQAELARRVGMRQSTMNSLINGDSRSSRKIIQIARELRTTPAFLVGEIDDPEAGAPPPPPVPRHQQVMLSVTLPNETALAAAFQGVLLASEGMGVDELARELAKRLPIVLRMSAGAIVEPASDRDDILPEPDALLAAAHVERRRA